MIERVLNFQINDMASTESLLLVPKRGTFRGMDGRTFNNSIPELIISRWKDSKHDIPIDVEHSTELRRPQGLPAPAVGWITELTIAEDGSIAGVVNWTEEGRELIESKKYRYYSPAYLVNRETGEVVGLRSVGLTNVPNLGVPALNHEGDEGENMDSLKTVCNSLGLGDGASEVEIVTEINTLKTQKAEAEERATKAEAKVAEMEKAKLKAEINSTVDEGVRDGKIAPATKDYFITSINTEEGLASFKEMLAKSPKLISTGEEITGSPNEPKASLNSEESAICAQLGLSEEEYRKAKEAE